MLDFNFKVVTLVGDAHYHQEFIQQANRLTIAGKLVQYQPILDPVTENSLNEDEREMLRSMQFERILRSDEIFVVNPHEGHLNARTAEEINLARCFGKRISYLREPKPDGADIQRPVIFIFGKDLTPRTCDAVVSEAKRLTMAGNVLIIDPLTSNLLEFSIDETSHLMDDRYFIDQRKKLIALADSVRVVNPGGGRIEYFEKELNELGKPVTYMVDIMEAEVN